MAKGSSGSGDEAPRPRSLADKLEHLFRTVHPRGRGPYSNNEVAEAIKRASGPKISGTYIWQLRKGVRDNPTKQHLEALAQFFRVDPAYFFDDAEADRIDAGLQLLTKLRDTDARALAARLPGLSPGSRAAVAELVAHLERLEGLSHEAPDQAAAEGDSPGPGDPAAGQ